SKPGLIGLAGDLQRLSVRGAVRAGAAPASVLRPIAGAARTAPAGGRAEERAIGDRARHAIDGGVHVARLFGEVEPMRQRACTARTEDHRLSRRDAQLRLLGEADLLLCP